MTPFTESLRYEYSLTPDSVVLDCGGFAGDWACGINARYGCRVIVLEPINKFWEQIRKRFVDNPMIRVQNIGIGSETCFKDFSVKGDMTGEFADNPETECVTIMSVQCILKMLSIGTCDLIKINTEGSEYEIMESILQKGLTERFTNFQIQWHDCAPNAASRRDWIIEKLSMSHELTWDFGWVWQNWRRKQ